MEENHALETTETRKKKKWTKEYQREYLRKWRKEHHEEVRKKAKEHREKNRDHLRNVQEEWYYKQGHGFPRKWISVDRFLPKPDPKNDHEGDVLVYVPPREGCMQHGFYLGKLRPIKADPEGKGNFFGMPTPGSEWTLWGWSYYEQPIPSHWARLPQPPEDGGEDREKV